MICIYIAIGQEDSTVRTQAETLKKYSVMDYTIVVNTGASQPAPLLYIAPYVGAAMGKEFMYNGKHVLIISDDLSKQAVAYRRFSLLLRRPPGCEAYPRDIFYLHSRLLECAAKLGDDLGGGSTTALPFVETQARDIPAYIPTNVTSIADGQIFLESDLFYTDTHPAVDTGLSISRVGGSTQIKATKKTAGTLRPDLADYRELGAFTQFDSDLGTTTQTELSRGHRTVEILKQELHALLATEKQVMISYALTHGFLDSIPVDSILGFEHESFEYLDTDHPDIFETVHTTKDLPEGEALNNAIQEYRDMFLATRGNNSSAKGKSKSIQNT